MRKTVVVLLLVACICSVSLVWRGVSSTSQPDSGSDETLTVTDLAGRRVTLKQPIKRVVLMRSFFMYELALVLGDEVEETLVGWDSSIQTGDRDAYLKFVERYPRLSQVTVLGDSLRDAVSPEAVLALKPDLVIMDTFMLEGGLKSVEQMERAGLPLLYLDFSHDAFRDPQRSLILLGHVLGKEERARRVTQFIDAELNKVFDRLGSIEGSEPSVYLEAGGRPREYGNTYGYDAKHKTSGWGIVMAQLRCRNIAAELVNSMGKINPEFLLTADPDVIVIAGAHWTDIPDGMRLGYYAEAADARDRLRAFTARPGWEALQAVKDRRVYGLHMRFPGHATGFVAAQQLAKWLYPTVFEDLDPEASLREFHEKFMPIDYSGTWMVGLDEEE